MHRIKMPFSNKYRSKITSIILDWVETWPKFHGGYIRSLQHRRERQREESDKTFEGTRPPENTELDFLALRMIDIFQYEEFQLLSEYINKIFPDLEIGIGNTFNSYFEEFSDSLTSGWWVNIGWIYRSNKPIGIKNSLHLPSLPPEVDTIEIALHKILPSIIVVTFDVYLNQTASTRLKKLQASKYLGDVKIESFFFKSRFIGMSWGRAEQRMKRTIIEWLSNIRVGIERSIQPYLTGGFMKDSKLSPGMPAIEVYGLKAQFKKRNGFVIWANSCRAWWESLGFRLYSSTYHNSHFAYIWSREGKDNKLSIPHRILVFEEEYLKALNLKMYGDDKRVAIVYSVRDFLDSIVAPFAAVEFLSWEVERVKEFRSNIFLGMINNKFWNLNFRKQLNLYGYLQQEIRRVERFLVEFDAAKNFIERDFKEADPNSLLYTDLFSRHKKEDNFEQGVFNEINFLRKTFDIHMSFLNKTFSSYVELLNVDAIYGLQIISVTLSVIALVAAIFGVLGNWKEIVQLL